MSEYQYYEFLAIDRPLGRAEQQALRSVSSRARITATSFTNHYEWGDFKGDPYMFMENWFDLHLYLANWGTRRLMMRVPKRFLDPGQLTRFLGELDWVEVQESGDNLIIDMRRDEVEADHWDEDSGWLASLAPLRADVVAGDFRLLYLLWLTAVQDDLVSDTDVEPLPGIGPLTGALERFTDFFEIDPDLVQAAAELAATCVTPSGDDLRKTVAAITEAEKAELLLRVIEGDSHVAAELGRRARKECPGQPAAIRTAGMLRQRAREIRAEYERAVVETQEADRLRQIEEAEKARRARLENLRQRGASVWGQIEQEIERRNASGYDRAVNLLSDLGVLAAEEGDQEDFGRRLASIRARHEKKGRFIDRLRGMTA